MAECKVHWLSWVQKERRKSPRNSRNERRAVPLLASKIGSKFLLLTSLSPCLSLLSLLTQNTGTQWRSTMPWIWYLIFEISKLDVLHVKKWKWQLCSRNSSRGDSLRKTPFLLLVLACCYQLLKSQNCLLAICSQEHDGSFPLFILRSSKPQL